MNYLSEFEKNRVELLNIILNLGYLYIFFTVLFFILFFKFKKRWLKIITFILFLGFGLLVYGQFIERFWIKETHINLNKGWNTRVVLISDQHLGVYKGADFMEDVVEKINKINNVDFVLIAGDLTFWPKDVRKEQLVLKKIKYPVYVSLGNHDQIQSGKYSFEAELEKVLIDAGVKLLHNTKEVTKNNIAIFGLGSLYADDDNIDILENSNPEEEKTILLLHNPDSTSKKYPNKDFSNTVTFAGHTHCGQIRIPWLYKKMTPVEGNFYNGGYYDLKEKGSLIISCGLGESGVPIRLFNRPEIVVVDL